MSEKEELKEKIIVYKNYANVLKKKNTINKESMERNQKLILKLQEENKRQQKEIKRLNNEIYDNLIYIEEVEELIRCLNSNKKLNRKQQKTFNIILSCKERTKEMILKEQELKENSK